MGREVVLDGEVEEHPEEGQDRVCSRNASKNINIGVFQFFLICG